MRKHGWLVGFPILAVVVTLFTGSARAVEGRSCSPTVEMSKGITGQACVTFEIDSGSPESSTTGSIVRFSQLPGRFSACTIYYDYESGPWSKTGSLKCYSQANLHWKNQPSFFGPCDGGNEVQFQFYLVYSQRFTPEVPHRTKAVSASRTCG